VRWLNIRQLTSAELELPVLVELKASSKHVVVSTADRSESEEEESDTTMTGSDDY